MITDVQAVAVLLPLAEGECDTLTADAHCAAQLDPFDGTGLLEPLGVDPEIALPVLLRWLYPCAPELGAWVRGLLLRNVYGRLGVTLGYGRVIEPAGRQYVLTDWDAARWPEAWSVAGYVQYTSAYPSRG